MKEKGGKGKGKGGKERREEQNGEKEFKREEGGKCAF